MSMGHEYAVPEEIETIQTDWGEQTQLVFAENTFEFEAMYYYKINPLGQVA